jgi:hypothetical protein
MFMNKIHFEPPRKYKHKKYGELFSDLGLTQKNRALVYSSRACPWKIMFPWMLQSEEKSLHGDVNFTIRYRRDYIFDGVEDLELSL